MATSVRRLIVAAIVAQLKTITILNEYNTEIGNSVVDWNIGNIDQAKLPQVEVKDPSESSTRKGTMDYAVLSIEIVGRIVDTLDNARNLLTDITEAMKVGPAYPANVYLSTLTDKPELLPDEKDKKAVKVTMAYEVKYRE
ncbi:MAG: hypothetical protein KAR42_18010 [candidate division Zixibacteria bacterium]|nr:hypothetical protein [candidate division Zixibacteria bacterium]